jgi:predicted deacylase
MKFLNVPVNTGELTYERVPVAEYSDGSPVAIPVVTIGGVKDGPTLYLQAGMHGDELTGIEICRRAIAEMDPNLISGTVVAIPVANVPSHITRTRGYRDEERGPIDMNRIPTGLSRGLLTERLFNIFFEQFVTQAQFTIDLHSALDGCNIAPFSYIWPDDNASGTLEMRESQALAYGADYIYYHNASAKFGTSNVQVSLSVQANQAGVPMMLAESGESRRVSHEFIPTGLRGIRNVMINMGMLEGEIDVPAPPRRFNKFTTVHANRGGGLRMHADLKQEVRSGDLVAEVTDVFGRITEQIHAPTDGFILRQMKLGSCGTGAELFWIGS